MMSKTRSCRGFRSLHLNLQAQQTVQNCLFAGKMKIEKLMREQFFVDVRP
jgi:hypothetical protein